MSLFLHNIVMSDAKCCYERIFFPTCRRCLWHVHDDGVVFGGAFELHPQYSTIKMLPQNSQLLPMILKHFSLWMNPLEISWGLNICSIIVYLCLNKISSCKIFFLIVITWQQYNKRHLLRGFSAIFEIILYQVPIKWSDHYKFIITFFNQSISRLMHFSE